MTTAPAVPTLLQHDGVPIPQLGFGVFKVEDEVAYDVVGQALAAGYRLIDTAKLYGNERGVGRAVADSGIPRDEIYVTTKVWNDDQGYDAAMRAFDGSMERLGLDVLDLLLVHWPLPGRGLFVETWRAFVELQASGRVRSIGVSNFTPPQLAEIIDATGVVPVVNQIELHPHLVQAELRSVDASHGILTEAWSPLGRGTGILEEPAIVGLAARHDVTPAQIVLAWHLALGNVVIPKTVTPARILENLRALDVTLAAQEVAAITALDQGRRIGPDPSVFNG